MKCKLQLNFLIKSEENNFAQRYPSVNLAKGTKCISSQAGEIAQKTEVLWQTRSFWWGQPRMGRVSLWAFVAHWSRKEEKGMTEDETVGWHHWLDGHELEQAPGVGDGQGGLACCSPWGRKELDTIEWLNWTELGDKVLQCHDSGLEWGEASSVLLVTVSQCAQDRCN